VWQTFADLLDPPENLYVRDPVGWVRDRLGEFMWSKQCEIAEALVEHRYVAVKSAHDTGKSHVASRDSERTRRCSCAGKAAGSGRTEPATRPTP
jgi:hypothetical protein